jgi:hypothetical protein
MSSLDIEQPVIDFVRPVIEPLTEPLSTATMIANDVAFGNKSEDECLKALKDKFDPFLIKNTNKFAIFDYIGSKCFLELKTRKFSSDKYKDTMIGVNKIKNAVKNERKVIFCFRFDDGLFYWEFDKMNSLTNGDLDLRLGGRTDRGIDERRPYYFIKTSAMKKIDF